MDKLNLIKNALSIFDKLDDKTQKLIVDQSYMKTFQKDEFAQGPDKSCLGLMIVTEGQLRVFTVAMNGKELTMYRLIENDLCLFTASCALHLEADILVTAEKETTALIIPAHLVNSLNNQVIEFSNFTRNLLASRFEEMLWIVDQTLFKSFDTRLANFLINESGLSNSDSINITHETISNHLGTAREVVSRMLKHFQSDEYIKIERGTIHLTNRSKLIQLANS